MKYFLSQIDERHGDFIHHTVIRFKAKDNEAAKQIQTHWAAHWYPFDNDELHAELYQGEYQYHMGSVAVYGGFCKEISETTYLELNGLISAI